MLPENQFYTLPLCLRQPVEKKNKEPRIKLFKRVNKSTLFQITFYLEDDDHKPVTFHNETIKFTCQLIKKNSYL